MGEMFLALDENGDGGLEYDEVLRAGPEVQKKLKELCQMDDLLATFKMLDYDDGGTVDAEEFCDGVMRLQNGRSPPEMTRLLRQGSDTLRLIKELVDQLSSAKCVSEGAPQGPAKLRESASSDSPDQIAAVSVDPPFEMGA